MNNNPNNNEPVKILFDRFLKQNNCNNLHRIKSRFSVADALIDSGSSTVIIEHKSRPCNSLAFSSAIFEKDKFDDLKSLARLLQAKIIYAVEFLDVILLFDCTDKTYEWSSIPCPKHNGSNEKVLKDCTFLKYSAADFIVSKRTYQRGQYLEFEKYLKYNQEK